MNEKPQQNKAIAENLDPRALQCRQSTPRPGLATLLDRAADQIRPAGSAPKLDNEVKQ